MSYKLFFALILTVILESNGSRILGIFPIYGKSHMMFFESLFKGLARQGHQVDIVSNFPLHKPYPNYTDFEIPELSPNLINKMTLDFMEKSFYEINMAYYMAEDLGNKICLKGFETPVLQNLIKTQHSPAYDLVIVEPLILLIPALTLCDGYRILGIFPLVAKSHMMLFEQTMKGLARRGHQVDVISVFPQKQPYPNYTDLEIPPISPKLVNNMTLDFVKTFFEDVNIVYYISDTFGNGLCEKGFENPVVQKLIKNTANPPYDLVIVEQSLKDINSLVTKMKVVISFIAVILFKIAGCHGLRILGIFPLNARSHMMFHEQTMKGLARRGHQVDVVSTFPQKKPYPNYTDLEIPPALHKFVNNLTYDFAKSKLENNLVYFSAHEGGNILCDKGLRNLNLLNILHNPQDPPYDLVVVEVSFKSV
ncbi:hypothetical protein KQX54_013953 [Cotesia glomerata]|uniref:Uncharacterized protein n=1 Tax=Cotesia glomerata TaxID=32391 RepID=A0AAV7ILR5_COTGL|nr:hypothetical protein KQX54_013953 [Cotesia glomerata]